MGKKYKRLSFEERVKIQTLLEEGRNKSYIARKLNSAYSFLNYLRNITQL